MSTELKPYFYINGHDFPIEYEAESESKLGIVENEMFVSADSYGYTDIQWTNFTGEELPIDVYTRITDTYLGLPVQPNDHSGDETFYNTPKTPHAVLKYWSQRGVPCNVKTNLEAYESGTYIIKAINQSNISFSLIKTHLELTQYEKPDEIEQTYWSPTDEIKILAKNNKNISATAQEIQELPDMQQSCNCVEDSPPELCIAPSLPEVETLQKYLRRYGYLPIFSRQYGRINITGKYCYNTTQALKQLQQDFGLTINGDCNEEVRRALLKLSQSEGE
ncbi:peptidoglycan-binding domain-containing protein [Methanosphaera sp.]|uniref:peptidoglycan-binding domain-containing protein n=1 Tax=Methanosphaera sp. TaxID=2666342 RepID=UPI002600CBFB|nr:peptidoglycan-binding domain-containing protein [Methanosphaera sp.]